MVNYRKDEKWENASVEEKIKILSNVNFYPEEHPEYEKIQKMIEKIKKNIDKQ